MMKTYQTLAEALADITGKYGAGVFLKTNLMISLLSDYVPNLEPGQRVFRQALRAGLGRLCYCAILKQLDSTGYFHNKAVNLLMTRAGMTEQAAAGCAETVEAVLPPDCWQGTPEPAKDGKALFERGIVFYRGSGALKDYDKAFECFRDAAAAGYGPAQHALANCYAKGRGTAKDLHLAAYWYEEADGNGHGEAKVKLRELGRVWPAE